MDAFLGLSRLPLWLSAPVLLGLTTAAAVIAPLYVRRWVSFEKLVVNNEVAGFKYATLGVIYAVLLALAVITVWEEYRDAEAHVDREAAAWATLYGLSADLPQTAREGVQAALQNYATAVIEEEWPAMVRGEESAIASAALSNLYGSFLAVGGTTSIEIAVVTESFNQLASLTESRRERLDKARGALPPVLGLVLLIGALLTVGFTLFFGAQNVVAQAAMTGILCFMIMLVLFSAVMLNHPFGGEIRVSSDSLEQAVRASEARGVGQAADTE
jgi:hypothetical protein